MNSIYRIGFGGGCHWCTEAVFMSLVGVNCVQQGFIKARSPNDAYSEAVIVTYDPIKVTLSSLIEVHLRTHASTSQHKMRGKYRSAIYAFDDSQSSECESALALLKIGFEQPLVTQVLRYVDFRYSNERYQNYYYNDQTRPFCSTYIDPKINVLKQRFSHLLDNSE